MKIDTSHSFSVYNSPGTQAADRPAGPQKPAEAQQAGKANGLQKIQRPQIAEKPSSAESAAATNDLKSVLSPDELKMFELLFPAEKETATSNTPARSYGVQERYQAMNKTQVKKSIGSFLDIRG